MWVLYSILSAWAWSTSDLFSKRFLLDRQTDEFFLIGIRFWMAVPFLLPLFFFIKIPHLDPFFWRLHLLWLPLEILAAFLYMRAIRISPLSLTLPLLSLTPLFLIFTAWIMIGERPSPKAAVGILLILVGSYLLYFQRETGGILSPLRRFFKVKGSLLMVLVAFIYSITSVFGKLLISHSSALFFSGYYPLAMALTLTPLTMRRVGKGRNLRRKRDLLLAGLFFAFMILFHMLALERAKVAYMISLKRLSGVFGVLYGWSAFKEEEVKVRLTASIIMVLGALLVSTG